jgi:hypothetical protein
MTQIRGLPLTCSILKMGYDVLVNKYGCKVQEMYTVQDHPPPTEVLLLPSLHTLYKTHV